MHGRWAYAEAESIQNSSCLPIIQIMHTPTPESGALENMMAKESFSVELFIIAVGGQRGSDDEKYIFCIIHSKYIPLPSIYIFPTLAESK